MENHPINNPVASEKTRPSRGWRIARWLLLGFATVATLLALFHTVENWRGKRAWQDVQRQLEAKGEVLDWNDYIPKPVPPEQNFFEAPRMREWFVKGSLMSGLTAQTNTQGPFRSYESFGKEFRPAHSAEASPTRLVVFHVKAPEGALNTAGSNSNFVLRLSDPEAAFKFQQLLQERLSGTAASAVHGFFVAEWPDHRPQIQFDLIADGKVTLEEMRQRFLPDSVRLSAGLRLDEDGTNAFKVLFDKTKVYLAADYLAWTDADTNDLLIIERALERPLTRIDDDYTRPFESPVPHFVRIRTVAQMLADRAECHLLLKNPQAALEELTLLHDFAQRMNAAPRFLVSAMIHVAVTGLYTSIIQDGLRLHAWQEPQLLVLEHQLRETELIPELAEALRTERAASSRMFEMSTAAELAELMGRRSHNFSQRIIAGVETLLIPRGWLAQNRAVLVHFGMQTLECFDLANQTVAPEELDRIVSAIQTRFGRFYPYTILASIAVPNSSRAAQVCARTQAMSQAALAACALERYHLTNGKYPEALINLVPGFLAEIPTDPIGGEPLRYRPTDSGYLLYSVGWNQKDDGGISAPTLASRATVPPKEIPGDWVWR